VFYMEVGDYQPEVSWLTRLGLVPCLGTAPDSPVGAEPDRPTGRVLVVDDSALALKLLVRALSKMGFEVDTATNGRDALELMKENVYVTVLMDFLMPVMDGISATKLFRSWETRTRSSDGSDDSSSDGGSAEGLMSRLSGKRQHVIGLSGIAEETDIEAAREAGVDHFISKSTKIDAVVDFVMRLKEDGGKAALDRPDDTSNGVAGAGAAGAGAAGEGRRKVSFNQCVSFRVIPSRFDLDKVEMWWSVKDLGAFKERERGGHLLQEFFELTQAGDEEEGGEDKKALGPRGEAEGELVNGDCGVDLQVLQPEARSEARSEGVGPRHRLEAAPHAAGEKPPPPPEPAPEPAPELPRADSGAAGLGQVGVDWDIRVVT